MNRLEVIFFSSFLLLISFFGISDPRNSFEWLMGAYDGLDVLRVSLALILLAFGILGNREGETTAHVFRTAGMFMLGLLAGNALFPDLYRQIDVHIMSLDVVAFIEGAVVCILYSLNGQYDETPELSGNKSAGKRSERLAKQA